MVFAIDYQLAPPPRWRDALGDVKREVGWVKENADRYGVNRERVALMGNSAGAHLALLAAYTEGNPELPPSCNTGSTDVVAVAALYPPTDLTRLYETQWPWWKPDIVGLSGMRRFVGGTSETVPERYLLTSLTFHVDTRDPPTFVVHGGDEQIMLLEQSELLARRLRKADVPYRLIELP